MMDDLETAALKMQIEALERRWREDAEQARTRAVAPDVFPEAAYQQGYADALDRCVQALRVLEHHW